MKDHDKTTSSDTSNTSPMESISENTVIDKRIKIYQKQLRSLASELSLTEARERREIASDLHDHIGQALAFVTQKVSVLRGNSIFSGMEDDFTEILAILEQTIRYTRNLTVELSPPVLYELGLYPAIEWLAERAGKRYKLKIISKESGSRKKITEDIRIFIFKSVQELITNTAKHAKANRVDINLTWKESEFQIIITDNGIGFDTTTFENGFSEKCCFGLFSIRERLSYIGGTFSIKASTGNGTKIIMRAPYHISKEIEND